MALFFVSLAGIILSVFTMVAFLGLWTYKDAQVKSEQSPGLWVLLVLFVPNMLGLIIYLLVGRTKKDVPAPGDYKKAAIGSAVMLALSTVLFVGITIWAVNTGRLDGTVGRDGTTSFMSSEQFRNGEWTFSARRVNGTRSRNPVLTAEEMQRFHVFGEIEGGTMYVRLMQGAQFESIHITDGFNGFIDLEARGFEPGRINVAIDFVQAERVRTVVSWR